ncbi:MAG: transcription elongation factor GreA [Acidimicrobiaceae bacterium]|uniref:GreA/GreB family elongation factor n=1 Tax=Candidatus Poriferisodalis multihospitum TaxID=2983191 RepID=UPI00138129FA|nr:transcription elongation factor GreA [Candidatus Poriferisodalis multihospitum]MCY3584883.1 transcription elongation factor GreA [Acidimicrobiaceae bacterium]MXY02849.1 transcription elongation factor GreA [Acidimicrobiales bacterium]MCY3609145.1 transcription elongation factor GreA [Acidimicrobiaceae bacterium]MCY3891860.1 transcription elongation factor GreA [Acidimicrobiaceae bacterium]MCY3948580.1 transcription elongation factor GreA [Acidimicrobiaceae bacterium]
MPEIHHISAETRDRLQAELIDLTGRGRIDIAAQIEAARLLGDLSENGDYHAAKEEQGKMEGRIMRLKAILENCEIVADSEDRSGDSVVAPGLMVSIRFQGDDEVEQYLFGSIEERRTGIEVVSPGSPMGQALEGARAGQTVTYEANGNQLSIEIVAIES